MTVCRTCNAEFEKAVTLKTGNTEITRCPKCKSNELHDRFPTPEEQRKKYRECIEQIKDDDY